MRNREAAVYSRWAAAAAALIVLTVVGVYAERAWRQARARRFAPASVPASVEQQSAQFSFSKVEQDRTIFTIRASQATQYRDQNHALLQDVWITVYGRDGNRNDNIHTRECTYEPISGEARCNGAVQIDIADAATSKANSPKSTLQLATSNLSFNRETGEASTSDPVNFSFPGGTGHGMGMNYSTKDSVVHVGGAIEFDLVASPKTGGMPVTAIGSSLEVRRDDRTVILNGPVDVRQGLRDLAAEKISVQLDQNNRAQRVVADGNPTIHSTEDGKKTAVSAIQFEGLLNPAGWVERIVADGKVAASRESRAGTDRFSAAHVEFAMVPAQNLIQDMTATGVTAESMQKGNLQTLRTDSLRVAFATGHANGTRVKSTEKRADHQSIESVETLAPGTIESKGGDETTVLRAKKFVAQVNPNGRINTLVGHSAVDMRRQTGKAEPQDVSAAEMKATFGADGDWASVDESGNVQFQQADRKATAARARMVRATDAITLGGSPVISDSASQTTASDVEIDQKTGEFRATGDVISTYVPERGDAVSLGSGPAHISADSLSGSVNAGHAAYVGHARLWQGDSVLDADRIELWRDEKKMQATGEVVAVFPQNAGPVIPAVAQSPAAELKPPGGPTLWKVQAPTLTYWSDQGRAHLSGGVMASSAQGTLKSRTLDIFLGAPAARPEATGSTSSSSTAGSPESIAPADARQLTRVLAQGGVVVRQGGRRGTAEQAEYTASDGKFVLSGGEPTVTDDSSDTVTGHSLTFFVASDTILVDSQEGSRTLTKHRVEK